MDGPVAMQGIQRNFCLVSALEERSKVRKADQYGSVFKNCKALHNSKVHRGLVDNNNNLSLPTTLRIIGILIVTAMASLIMGYGVTYWLLGRLRTTLPSRSSSMLCKGYREVFD